MLATLALTLSLAGTDAPAPPLRWVAQSAEAEAQLRGAWARLQMMRAVCDTSRRGLAACEKSLTLTEELHELLARRADEAAAARSEKDLETMRRLVGAMREMAADSGRQLTTAERAFDAALRRAEKLRRRLKAGRP